MTIEDRMLSAQHGEKMKYFWRKTHYSLHFLCSALVNVANFNQNANHSFSFALNRNETNSLSNGKKWPFLMFFSLKFTNIHSKISNFICETSCTIGTYISVEHFTPNTMQTRFRTVFFYKYSLFLTIQRMFFTNFFFEFVIVTVFFK